MEAIEEPVIPESEIDDHLLHRDEAEPQEPEPDSPGSSVKVAPREPPSSEGEAVRKITNTIKG